MKDFFSYDPKLLFFGFAIVFFASFGQTFFISIYNIEIRTFYNLTDGEFGFIYAMGTLFSSLIFVWFAKLIDYVDLRIYSLIIALGLSITCLSMYLPYKSIIFLFFIIFALRFFGQGAMSHAGETTMARYFDVYRGKALAVSTFGGMIGVMLLPLVVVYFNDIFGWRYVWFLSSLSILLIFIPLIFFVLKDQKLRHLKFSETTSKFNYKVWNIKEVTNDKKFYIYLPISIAASFISTGLTFHQIFIITEKGWSLEMLARGFIFLGIFSIVGLIIGGPIVDRFNTKKVVLFNLTPLFFAVLILVFFSNYLSMFFYMSLLGLSLGIGTPFIGSLWAELYGLKNIGTVKGLLHACMVFSSALSPVIFGYMIDLGLGILSLSIMSLLIISISTILPIIYKS